MSLLENNSICKDGGGIHYQQLGWNDNTHYTAISLHKAANGSNHSTLINKTLSFVSTWRASSIFHWDSHSWARQHRSNILTAVEQISIVISCVGSYAKVRINAARNKRAISEIILCARAAQNDHHISAGVGRRSIPMYQWSLCQVLSKLSILKPHPVHGILLNSGEEGRRRRHETSQLWRLISFILKPKESKCQSCVIVAAFNHSDILPIYWMFV